MRRAGTNGVTWMMGGPARSFIPHVVIAVAGHTVIMRHNDGNWRNGSYMNEDEAEKGAMAMTSKYEKEGLRLIAGPAEFHVDHDDPESDTLHLAILNALNL